MTLMTNMIRSVLGRWVILALAWSAVTQAAEPVRIGTTQSLTGHYSDQGTEQLRQHKRHQHEASGLPQRQSSSSQRAAQSCSAR